MRSPVVPLFLLALTLSACTTRSTTSPPEAAPPPAPMVGGFQAREVGDDEVVKAAEEAVKLLQASDPSVELVGIRSAQAQVVAGMNYRLELELKTADGEKASRVVVFRALDGEYSLTSSDSIE